MGFLLAQDMPSEELVGMVGDAAWPEDSLIMLFSPTHDPLFDRFRFEEALVKAADQGRIFSPKGEFKWRRMGLWVRAVYLGNDASPVALLDHSHELDGMASTLEELILWGVRSDLRTEWIEQQVPHRFDYPVDGKRYSRGRISLVVEHWIDGSGIRRFSRYHSVKEIQGESDAAR